MIRIPHYYTGAAIHRRLLAALQPAVLIVEEAAEV
jgi:hypothetical protein